MSKTALILGVGGQDGSYLADILLEKNYAVHGLYRRTSLDGLSRIRHLGDRVVLHRGDVTDAGSLAVVLHDVSPDEVYHVADQDHVGTSWDCPQYTLDITTGSTLRVLDAVRTFDTETADRRCDKKTRVFIPISATVFGDAPSPQTETSPTDPQSPYAACKLAAWSFAKMYRAKYGMHVSCAILYNHDSPRRGPGFLLGDLVRQALTIKYRKAEAVIKVGDPLAYVDIGHARDYMEAAVAVLQLPDPDDYVLASGELWQVGDVVNEVMRAVGIKCEVVTTDAHTNKNGNRLMGDYRKAHKAFGFTPKTLLRSTVQEVVKELSKEYQ